MMLEPTHRQHLLQALRPPEGYELSFAIGTTYSLDLTALLSIPLAFAEFDWEDNAGRPCADPLAMLEALRRYAERLHIFCQLGNIAVPPRAEALFSYLEGSVFQVQAPLGGVFHPKLWVLRFEAPDQPAHYRLLCLSRNLTFDSSWDTLLVLDGYLTDRVNAYAPHHPLGDFIQALPDLAQADVPAHVRKNIATAQHELRRVDFSFPGEFDEYRFWPVGIKNYSKAWPFDGRMDRILVVSPFLTPDCLERATKAGADHVLMSGLESLGALRQQDLGRFRQIFAFNSLAELEEAGTEPADPLFSEGELTGLHAKLYVVDDGWRAHVWTGSANATHAAFNTNVEFLIELSGKKSYCGVETFLKTAKGQVNFADLWVPFTADGPPIALDPLQQELEDALRLAQTALAAGRWRGDIGTQPESGAFTMVVSPSDSCRLGSGIEVVCWPLTVPNAALAVPISETRPVMNFGPLAFESLTAFIAFRLTARRGERSMSAQFVLHIPLLGVPEDRLDRLLRSLLRDQNQVLRFFLLILADGKDGFIGEQEYLRGTNPDAGGTLNQSNSAELPLFESLLQALHSDPHKLDQIARTVADLERTAEGQQLLPEGFRSIWGPIWEARQGLSQ